MRIRRNIALAIVAGAVAWAACAADNNLLIQLAPGGGYQVWHAEGKTQLSEDEALLLASSAEPQGGAPQRVAAGTARAFQIEHGVVVELADAASDKRILIDRDECGAVKLWHSEGETRLTEEQLTDLVISALPGGGRRVSVGDDYAKAFVVPLGYAVVIWRPVVRPH